MPLTRAPETYILDALELCAIMCKTGAGPENGAEIIGASILASAKTGEPRTKSPVGLTG